MRGLFSALLLGSGFLHGALRESGNVSRGQELYRAGEMHQAARQFESVLKIDATNAEACYWLAMSYQTLMDVATPFGGRYRARAHRYFARAMQFAPGNSEYRMAFFDFLLDAADSSTWSLREAQNMLKATPECDPQYVEMRRRLAAEERAGAHMERRAARILAIAERSLVK